MAQKLLLPVLLHLADSQSLDKAMEVIYYDRSASRGLADRENGEGDEAEAEAAGEGDAEDFS